MSLFPTVFLLGLAGFDLTGAMVVIYGLSIGVSRKQIFLFAATTFGGTVAVGILCSRVLGTGISILSEWLNKIPDSVYMAAEFVISFLLLKWFAERAFLRDRTERKEEKKESFFIRCMKRGMLFVGVLFSVSALADPSFLALTTIAGQVGDLFLAAAANCIWILISQLPLFILTASVLRGRHEEAMAYFRVKVMENERLKKLLDGMLTILILAAGVVLLADAGWFFMKGVWLI